MRGGWESSVIRRVKVCGVWLDPTAVIGLRASPMSSVVVYLSSGASISLGLRNGETLDDVAAKLWSDS